MRQPTLTHWSRSISWAIVAVLVFTNIAISRDVTIEWDRSLSDVGNGTYKIYWGNSSGDYPNVYDYGNVTTASVLGLSDLQSWYFAATYADYRGESGFSNEAVVPVDQQSIAAATNVIITWQQVEEPPTMAISYVNKNTAVGKAVSLTGVTAGNLIVAMIQWQDNATNPTLSDGTNAPDAYSTKVTSGSEYIRFAYWLSSPKSGSVTYTWTASGGGHTSHVFEMSCTAGNTWALEDIDAPGTTGGSTATSGDETSTETSMVAFGGAGSYTGAVYSSALIDEGAVDQYVTSRDTGYGASGHMTMRVMNNPGTYHSDITLDAPSTLAADVISFREVAGAGGATALPRRVLDGPFYGSLRGSVR